MITTQNLSEILDSLSQQQVDTAMQANHDYVLFEVFICNSGFSTNLESMDYSEEVEQEASNNGNVFIDKDTFLQLYEDSNSINPYLTGYL